MVILTAIGASVYVMKALADPHVQFTTRTFFSWLIVQVVANSILFRAFWKHRNYFSKKWQAGMILWAGISFWFWLPGPVYHLMNVTLNNAQLRVTALVYFWEVPVFGLLFTVISLRILRPVLNFKSQHADPEQLIRQYRQILRYPFKVGAIIAMICVSGYFVGGLQVLWLQAWPMIEVYKNLINGMVLGALLVLFYYLSFDLFLGKYRQIIRGRAKKLNVELPKRYFSRKIFSVITGLSFACLALLFLFVAQSYQLFIRRQVTDQMNMAATAFQEQHPPDSRLNPNSLTGLRMGDHGQAFVLETGTLSHMKLSGEVSQKVTSNDDGVLFDNYQRPKVIRYFTRSDHKIVMVADLYDFYGPLTSSIPYLLYTLAIVLIIAIAFIIFFSSGLTRIVQRLASIVAVQTSGQHENMDSLHAIDSGDEFGNLADAYQSYINRVRSQNTRLIQEQARLESSINSLDAGFFITDNAQNIVTINIAAMRMFGGERVAETYTVEYISEILGHKFSLEKAIKASISDRRSKLYKEVIYETKLLNIFIAPIASENREHTQDYIGAVVLFDDVTEEKVLQRSRDEFFSIASHELRTPLTAIRGNTDMLLTYYEQLLKKNPEVREMIDDVHESSVRLIEIVNDFLDASSLEQGKFKYNLIEINAEEIIESIVYDMGQWAKQKGISLDFDGQTLGEMPKIYADQNRLKQVVYNLVSNAVKFTDEGSVKISLTVEKSMMRITVSDTGHGIAKEQQTLLFRKFQQAGENILTRDNTRGTGLGLYISRLMMQGMHGTLEFVSSEVGKGTTFALMIPLAEPNDL